jgi:uncharacterized membrane protein
VRVYRFVPLRVRLWWDGAFWVIPLMGIVAAYLLDQLSVVVDEALFNVEQSRGAFSAEATVTLLAAIGGGMVTFTGFVFSVVLLMVQFGSSEYSPRTVSYFLRSRTMQWVLALFLATIVFCFLSLLEVGSQRRADFVPIGSVSMAIVLLLASLVGFLALLTVVGRRIRVDDVLSDIGRRARKALPKRFFLPRHLGTYRKDGIADPAPDARSVRFTGASGQVVAVDAARLVRIARRHRCRITLLVRTGDALAEHAQIALVEGGEVSDHRVSRCFTVKAERSWRLDPLYALRILSDVSLRALSPAVNDPTTAVRSLDEVEGVLRTAAGLPLGEVEVSRGRGSVVFLPPTWSNLVDVAFLEVVDAGLDQPQVTRRLTAMFSDLLADLPEERRAALERYRRRLVEDAGGDLSGEYRRIALTGDRQGVGGSRRTATPRG